MAVPITVPSTKNLTDMTPTASDAEAVTATVPATCAPPAGEVMLTVGAVVSAAAASDPTITVTGAEVPTFPAASRPSARSVCDPSPASFEFQRTLYGAFVSVPITVPSTVNVTDLTPTASDAAAVMFTFRETFAPAAGDVMLIDGAVVSADDWAARGTCDQLATMRAVTANVRTGAVISRCCGNDAAMFKIGSWRWVRVPGFSGWVVRMAHSRPERAAMRHASRAW